MASIIYNGWKSKDGNDWAAGADSAYKAMLVTGSYTPNPDHTTPNATGLASNEVTGGSYARQNVAGRARTKDDTNDRYDHSANNPTFAGLSSAAPRYVVIYRAVTDDSDHQLVCCIDLGEGLSVTGNLLVKWNETDTSGVVFRAA